MSKPNSIHGWYTNKKTGTAYECRFVVSGSSIKVISLENKNYTKNYLGETAFEIISSSDDGITVKSTNDVYGDKDAEYTFYVK